jgi:hypothetical protein
MSNLDFDNIPQGATHILKMGGRHEFAWFDGCSYSDMLVPEPSALNYNEPCYASIFHVHKGAWEVEVDLAAVKESIRISMEMLGK